MGKYKKCPRCELNYIPVEDDYCDVCKVELGKSNMALIEEDDDELLEEEGRICPECKINYLDDGEDMCATCRAEKASKTPDEPDPTTAIDGEDDSWKEFVEEDAPEEPETDNNEISLAMLQEEEEEDADEDVEEESKEVDDFDESIPDFDENDYVDDDDEDADKDEDDDDLDDEDKVIEKPVKSKSKKK